VDSFWANWLLLLVVFPVALASPGPDFVMAVRNSVMYSRRAGVFTAIGFGLGVAVHVTYCLAGLALVIAQSVVLFNIIKWIGAAYLFYVGVKALRSRGMDAAGMTGGNAPSLTPAQALRSGFVTNLFNPKATMFFLALFTQVLDPQLMTLHKLVYGLTCVVMTVLWFSVVATVLTAPPVRARFLRLSRWIDRVCGGLFIALGLKLALTRAG
jgi:RhtB (resistance to homoserine/threonine) family protein